MIWLPIALIAAYAAGTAGIAASRTLRSRPAFRRTPSRLAAALLASEFVTLAGWAAALTDGPFSTATSVAYAALLLWLAAATRPTVHPWILAALWAAWSLSFGAAYVGATPAQRVLALPHLIHRAAFDGLWTASLFY